ncbi:unknown [Gryllus bimaculatus nudivirus]|uniref:Uncharacterized protein n=1 Tax=Gryllus bimaculatus nudivirus TaxID=432587 RepID=A4L203_9VIRU|nr:hypothetical protein GrBNV_gp40 [Gryllus bimaculatus nudivirus]ABO45373.1 unknown [Gryllus bimaculatus nudivirus]
MIFIESFNDILLQKLKEKLEYKKYKVVNYGVFQQIKADTAFGREEQRCKTNLKTYLLIKEIFEKQPDLVIHSPLHHFMKLCAEVVFMHLKSKKTICEVIKNTQTYLNQQFPEELKEQVSQENIVFILEPCTFLKKENTNTKLETTDYVLENCARRIVEKYICKYFNFKKVYRYPSAPLECVIYDILKYNIVFVKNYTPNKKFDGVLQEPKLVSTSVFRKEAILKFNETIITTNQVKFSIESKNKQTIVQHKIWEPFLPHSLSVIVNLDTYHDEEEFIVTFSEEIEERNIVYVKNDAELRSVIIWCHNKMGCDSNN